jgi:hypothetical protein
MGSDNVATFISSAGEDKTVPVFLLDGFLRAYKASKCAGCRHCHFADMPPVVLPPEVLKAFSLPSNTEPV